MNEKQFVGRRKADWDRLTALVDRSDHSIRALSGSELREFGRLYRRVAGDLAYLRTHSDNSQLIRYLNDLVGRGHGVLYRHPSRSVLIGLVVLFRESAAAVRRRRVFVLLSILITVLSAAFAWAALDSDPEILDVIVPPGFRSSLDWWKEQTFENVEAQAATAGTGFYILNNTMASIYAAAGGLTFGLLSVYLLFSNGIVLGAFMKEIAGVGGLGHFAVGVLPHGITELGGIFIAGGAGLMMGWALLNPGRRTRLQSLRAVGKDTTLLIGLGVCMIWIAAPIEAWISFGRAVPDAAKLTFAGLSLAMWMLFFFVAGRDSDQATDSPSHGEARRA
ncbi:MAG: stage II sporulation protein M [Armatimonadetes bacterium]|nr:stage II sporulation protein M [Armatimonadota bacterium]